MPDQGQQGDERRGSKPGLSVFITPVPSGEIQYPPHNAEREVDGLVGPDLAYLFPISPLDHNRSLISFDKRPKGPVVNLIERKVPDMGHYTLKMIDLIIKRDLLLAQCKIVCGRFFERDLGTNAEQPCLAPFIQFRD